MEFLAAEFIRQRRKGSAVTEGDLDAFVGAFVRGEIPDYQVAAWLMAVCFRPLSAQETAWLTNAMVKSGRQLKFTSPVGLSVDKHSTGGVGDKTSLILGPIVAACGLHVPMMAGRALGHTGGTLDKLEAIPGMKVRCSLEQFQSQVENVGIAIVGQTDEICPADRKMYSLRDVTGTIDSLSLICASILSKKIAEGCQALVLDVKFGSGAFMKSLEEAEALGSALIQLGQSAGLKVSALLTDMSQPLGRFVGNALEIQECLEILKREKIQHHGKSAADTESLSLDLAAQMLLLAERCPSLEAAHELAYATLESGQAYEKFAQMVVAQGGDLFRPMARANQERLIVAESEGYISFVDVEKIGLGCIVLGAGRKKSTDMVDPSAGLEVFVKSSQKVKKGEPLFKMYAADDARLAAAEAFFRGAMQIRETEPTALPLIAKVLQ